MILKSYQLEDEESYTDIKVQTMLDETKKKWNFCKNIFTNDKE